MNIIDLTNYKCPFLYIKAAQYCDKMSVGESATLLVNINAREGIVELQHVLSLKQINILYTKKTSSNYIISIRK